VSPRYSSLPFPEYRHRPGVTPHPVRDEGGHSYKKESLPAAIEEGDWHTADTYLFAIDLINDGYFWEAHEQLEGLWLGTGRDTPIGQFLQGLIQAAAALLKLDAGKIESAGKLTQVAAAKLRKPCSPFLGLDGECVARDLEQQLVSPGNPAFKLELEMPY
jgi:hypothetical protein